MNAHEFVMDIMDDLHDDIDSEDVPAEYVHYFDGPSGTVMVEYESGMRLKITVEEL